MIELWKEPLGLFIKCPVCQVEITINYDKRNDERPRAA